MPSFSGYPLPSHLSAPYTAHCRTSAARSRARKAPSQQRGECSPARPASSTSPTPVGEAMVVSHPRRGLCRTAECNSMKYTHGKMVRRDMHWEGLATIKWGIIVLHILAFYCTGHLAHGIRTRQPPRAHNLHSSFFNSNTYRGTIHCTAPAQPRTAETKGCCM
jgi:hypothetical protein